MSARAVLSGAVLMSAGILVGRVLGFAREMLMASHFGISSQADFAIAMLILPDFITNVLIGAAISGAFVPAFASRSAKDAHRLFWHASVTTLGLFLVIALILAFNSKLVMDIILPHTSDDADAQVFAAASWAFLALPFTALTGITTAFLQANKRFLAPALATILFNMGIIADLLLAPPQLLYFGMAIFGAVLFRLVPQCIAVARCRSREAGSLWHPWQLDSKLLKIYAVAAGTGLLALIPLYIPYFFAAQQAHGSVAIFNYSFKLVLLPANLLQTVIMTVLLPYFIDWHKQQEAARTRTIRALYLFCWIASLAMTVAFIAASHVIIYLCFDHGQMTPENLDAMDGLFILGILSMPAAVLGSLWQSGCYARGDVRTPFTANLVQASLTVIGCIIFYQAWQVRGVMAAYALVQWIVVFYYIFTVKTSGYEQRAILPAMETLLTGLAVLGIFAPFAWWIRHSDSLPGGFVIALIGGACALAAGCAASQSCRHERTAPRTEAP